ncbi:MAG TPA: TlpA disulfide reductase family protein [Arachidicoccus sp.]
MKNKKLNYLFAVILSLTTFGTFAQYKPAFSMYPDQFAQGEDIRVVYHPDIAGYNDSNGVKASVYLFRNFNWEGYDLPIHKTDSGWAASYKVPIGSALIGFHFYVGDSLDKGQRFPYMGLVHEVSEKNMMPGSYLEWGLVRTKQRNGKVPDIVSASSEIVPQAIMIWIGKEWGNFSVVSNLLVPMTRELKKHIPDEKKADTVLNSIAESIMKKGDSLSEKQWVNIQRLYNDVLMNRQKADSVKRLIITKFPNGFIDRLTQLNVIMMQRDSAQKANTLHNFLAKYPPAEYPIEDYEDVEIGDPTLVGHICMDWAGMYYKAHNWDSLSAVLHRIPFSLLDYFYTHYIEYPFRTDKPGITPKEAYILSSIFMREILSRLNNPDARISGRNTIAPYEWKKQQMLYYSSLFAYHLGLMCDNGEYEQACMLAEEIEPFIHAGNLEFNDKYVHILQHLNKNAQVIPFIRTAVYVNTATPEMLDILKDDFAHINGNDKGFIDYYHSLRNDSVIEKEHEALKNSIINISGLDFNLKDMNGHNVSLSSLKGKVVVLDFWATWCFPCKAAMPGMRIAVQHYKNDTSVAFYFISTLEESADYKPRISTFLKQKDYDFNVLCDDESDSTGHRGKLFSTWAHPLKLNGIPQKIVLDANGNVRWIASGFYGNVLQVADEVSYIIELLKKGK